MNERISILSRDEITVAVQAFLQSPDRVTEGADEQEIIKVINWLNELKCRMWAEYTLLYGIYTGEVVLDLREDGEVIMKAHQFEPIVPGVETRLSQPELMALGTPPKDAVHNV